MAEGRGCGGPKRQAEGDDVGENGETKARHPEGKQDQPECERPSVWTPADRPQQSDDCGNKQQADRQPR